MSSQSSRTEAGFSLIELIVAMAVTLVITGAVYGLMSGGQNAFRREPELTDRQQNIRVAMDVIMRDVANAGAGMPPWMQIFTRDLDACVGCPNGGAPMGPDGARTDELELITNASGKDNEPTCNSPGNSGNLFMTRGATDVVPGTVVLILMADGTWSMRNVVSTSANMSSSGNCEHTKHVDLNTRSGGDGSGMNPPGGACEPNNFGTGTQLCGPGQTPALNNCMSADCVPKEISFAEVVRYRIRNGADGVPQLERFSSGNQSNFSGGQPVFQAIARGIENLQVQYTQASTPNTWVNGAPTVVRDNYPTLIQQVRVTLAARSEAANIQGATNPGAAGPARIRGSLTSTGSPRAALIHLARGPLATQQWR